MRKTLAFLSAAALLAAGVPAGSVIGTEALHEEETSIGVRTRGHYYYDKISDTESGRKVKAIYDYVDSYCEKLIRPEIPAGVTCIGEDAFFLPKDWDQNELPF